MICDSEIFPLCIVSQATNTGIKQANIVQYFSIPYLILPPKCDQFSACSSAWETLTWDNIIANKGYYVRHQHNREWRAVIQHSRATQHVLNVSDQKTSTRHSFSLSIVCPTSRVPYNLGWACIFIWMFWRQTIRGTVHCIRYPRGRGFRRKYMTMYIIQYFCYLYIV